MPTSDNSELAFSQIAYSFLGEKAPKLAKHILGFEVIEREEETDRMMGVFSFQIGNKFLFAPVFFQGGRLRPLDLLYLRDQGAFVPLSDEMVDYLFKDENRSMGDPIDIKKRYVPSPDLRSFIDYPQTGRYVSASGTSKVAELLAASSNHVKQSFINALRKNRKFLDTIVRFGDYNDFVKACELKPVIKKADTVQVEVVLPTADPEKIRDLDESDKDTLSRGEIVVKDRRTDTSKLYAMQYLSKFQNPPASGFYYVINNDGNFIPCIVIVRPKSLTSKHAADMAIVFSIETSDYAIKPIKEVWVRENWK